MGNWSLEGKKHWLLVVQRGLDWPSLKNCCNSGQRPSWYSYRKADLLDAVQMFRKRGLKAKGMAGDITDGAFRTKLVRDVERKFSHLDILVNNVGTNIRKKLTEYTESEYRKIFETNLFALVEMARLCHPLLKKSGKGSMVNIASVAGSVDVKSGPLME